MGVFLSLWSGQCRKFSLPHARGGVSIKRVLRACCEQSSPRPWGCFSRGFSPPPRTNVFPTPVGVFLWRTKHPPQDRCLPRSRGGVSIPCLRPEGCVQSSPRPWGCFFCASLCRPHVMSLPHARGGVSKRQAESTPRALSSPRPWGCFSVSHFHLLDALVFPTPVGVFLCRALYSGARYSLPHARGGVSTV